MQRERERREAARFDNSKGVEAADERVGEADKGEGPRGVDRDSGV